MYKIMSYWTLKKQNIKFWQRERSGVEGGSGGSPCRALFPAARRKLWWLQKETTWERISTGSKGPSLTEPRKSEPCV